MSIKDWPIVKIGDVCDLATGGTPPKSRPECFGGDIRWLVSGDIHQKEITDCEGRITEEGLNSCNTKVLPVNSVMIALNGQGKTRATVAMLRTEATCNQSLVSIFPKDTSKLLPEFIYLNLHGRYEELRRITGDSGNERRGLNMRIIRKIKIPLPPLSEQRRIVSVLDAAFAGLATAEANTRQNLTNTRELFGKQLNNVFAQTNASSKRFGDVCDFVRGPFGGSLKKSMFVEEGYAVYEQQHAIGNRFDNVRYRVTEEKFQSMSRFEVKPGELIMSCSGTMGRVAIVPKEIERGIINQALLKISPRHDLSAEYLDWWMKSDSFFDQLGDRTKGVAIKNVASVKILKEISLPCPSLEEQGKLVDHIESLCQAIEGLVQNQERKFAALAALKQSLLHRAFRGELSGGVVAEQLSEANA